MSARDDIIVCLEKGIRGTSEISKMTGASKRHVRRVRNDYDSGKTQTNCSEKKVVNKEEVTWNESEKSAQWSYTGNEKIETLEEALERSDVDLEVWRVDKFRIKHNAWDMSYKGDGHETTNRSEDLTHEHKHIQWESKTTTNRQVTVTIDFVRKEREFIIEQSMKSSIEQMKKHSPVYKTIKYPKKKDDSYLALISIVDGHTGKLTLKEECGVSYGIEESIIIRDWAIDQMVDRIQNEKIHKILYIMGNDDIHIDNKKSQTTYGTYVDTIGKWWQMFEAVKKSHVRSIDKLRCIAPVEVKSMKGNHDEHLSFFMGATIDAWYQKCKEVNIDYYPAPQKYFFDGVTLLGISHGREEKRTNLPLIMATDVPELWSKAKCREWITGDKHHKKSVKYIGSEDMQTIIVRTLPTLSATDYWHKNKGYLSTRAAEAYLYHQSYGLDRYYHIPLRAMK